jgi:hypothetical protein
LHISRASFYYKRKPLPNRQDEKQREVFRRQLQKLCQQAEVDIWFADESGFEGDPQPRRRWNRKGHKSRVTKKTAITYS